jgi:hypothetical protein
MRTLETLRLLRIAYLLEWRNTYFVSKTTRFYWQVKHSSYRADN